MDKWIFQGLFILSVLSGCGFSTSDDYSLIVGGEELDYTTQMASSVVTISTEGSDGSPRTCTGTFISEDFILTASHCIASRIDGMGISFRRKNFTSTGNVQDIPIVSLHKLDFSKVSGVKRNDLALIRFRDGLPAGATAALLPDKMPDKKLRALTGKVRFTALGYGQTTGLISQEGLGVLRYKSLFVDRIDARSGTFKVDQHKNKGGVCNGDSGGPALVQGHQSKKNVVIGVASQKLFGRIIDGVTITDNCKNESLYMNMFFFGPYLTQQMKLLSK